jgi:hypothetical protein
MPPTTPPALRFAPALITSLGLATLALAQPARTPKPAPAPAQTKADPADVEVVSDEEVPAWLKRLAPRPDDPAVLAYASQQRERLKLERELKRLRYEHFQRTRRDELRDQGLAKIWEYGKDRTLFPTLIQIFQHEGQDVARSLIDLFERDASDEGDAAITWMAVYNREEKIREHAAKRLTERLKAQTAPGELPEPSYRVRAVIAGALGKSEYQYATRGAEVVQAAGLSGLIPWLVSAQVASGGGSGGERGGRGDLAWIFIGQTVWYVADVTPVVGEQSIAFDPQIAPVNTGALLRVHDAVVIEYRTIINTILIGMASEVAGRDMASLGFDQRRWREWLADEYPGQLTAYREKVRAEASASAAAAPPASGKP